MAQNVGGITLDTSVLDKITAEMKPKAAKIVNAYGLKVASEWAADVPVDTGNYRNSITSESGMTDDMTFTAQDGTDYGVFVELGTNKMAARPSLVPALENNTQPFQDAFAELFK